MGRGDPDRWIVEVWKTGTTLFKPRHVKSRDKLFKKYKKSKNHQNFRKTTKIGLKPTILTKSAIEDSNQNLQSNEYLIFTWDYKIIRIDLKTMNTKHKNFRDAEIKMCAIPNQKYFCIDFSNNLIFYIDKNFKISERRVMRPREDGPLIYLDGLIYLLTAMKDDNAEMETYDLTKGKWKKIASFNFNSVDYPDILATFEGKILLGPYSHGILSAYDPFCNSFSIILKLESSGGITLLVANDKVYCIQSEGYVFESLPRDYTQWTCIGKNSMVKRVYGLTLYSLYKDSIYFVSPPYNVQLFEFNLKTRNITFVDNLY